MLPGRANADAMKAFTGRPVSLKISSFRQLGSLLYCVSIVFLLIYVLSCSFQCIVFLLVFVGPTSASTLRTGYHIVVTLVGAWLHFNPGAQPSSAASCPLRLLPFSLMLQWTSEDQPLMEEIQNTGYPIWVVWHFNHQLMLRRSWSENFA